METEISPYSWSPITWNKKNPHPGCQSSPRLGFPFFRCGNFNLNLHPLTIASWVAPFGNDDLAGLPLSWSILLVCGEVWTVFQLFFSWEKTSFCGIFFGCFKIQKLKVCFTRATRKVEIEKIKCIYI